MARLLLIGALISPMAVAQVDPSLARGRLAVLDFRNKLENPKEVDATYFADVVRAASLKAVPELRVLTRENLIVLLQSTGRKLEECEGECEVDTGRRIGADLVISGDLLKVGTNYKLNLRLHETRGGELLSGTVASGKTVDDLDAATGAAVNELLQPLRNAASQPPVTRTMPATHNSPPVQASTGSPLARRIGWGVGAAGVLLAAGSGYFAYRGHQLANEVKNGEAPTGADLAQKALDSGATNSKAIILGAAGGAALITAALLVWLNPAQPVQVAVSGSGVVVAGRF